MSTKKNEMGVTAKLQGIAVVKIDEFKYVGSAIQSNGMYTREVKEVGVGGDEALMGCQKDSSKIEREGLVVRSGVMVWRRWH